MSDEAVPCLDFTKLEPEPVAEPCPVPKSSEGVSSAMDVDGYVLRPFYNFGLTLGFSKYSKKCG
jgi:hypothetical protein